jgi:hypothetical protein
MGLILMETRMAYFNEFELFEDTRLIGEGPTEEDQQVSENLRRHVEVLATRIGPRNTTNPKFSKALREAASYIENSLTGIGFTVNSQIYETSDGHAVRNLEVVIPGSEKQALIIGAHYDSVYDCPGANDNASSVACLLETARHLSGKSLKRTLRLVAFVNEEPPYFSGPDMGSKVYARSLDPAEVHGMLCLETMGYYSNVLGSQRMPPGLDQLYTNRCGNFLLLFADRHSRGLLTKCLSFLRKATNYKIDGLVAPDFFKSIAASDQLCFWERGIPAIMVTDTVYFRYDHYHKDEDTAEKLNYDAFGTVANGFLRGIAEMAS